MHPDPNERPSASELLHHPLLCSKSEQKSLKHKQKILMYKSENEDLKLKLAQLEAQLQTLPTIKEELKLEKDRVRNLETMTLELIRNSQRPTS